MPANPGRATPSVNWTAAAQAGLIGGVAYLVLELILVPLFVGGTVWNVLRMISAIILGRDALPPPDTFDLPIMLTAVALHLALSTAYGLVLSAAINRSGPGVAVLVGAMFGLLLYIVNFYMFTEVFPWFANARTWVTVFNHLVFGFAVAWSYKTVSVTPRRSWTYDR